MSISNGASEKLSSFRNVVVIGAGTMGAGIAHVAAIAGYDVALTDLSSDVLDQARGRITASLARAVEKGKLSLDASESARTRILYTVDAEAALQHADLVVEAVYEDEALKCDVLGYADALISPSALLASNTSSIPITRLAAATSLPERVVGLHFFSPVTAMPLVEMVRGEHTSDDTLDRARDFAETLGKTCITVNVDVAGFVTTRLITALVMEAVRLAEAGVATPEEIDTACELGFGHRMGPLKTADLVGLDVLHAAGELIAAATHQPQFAPPELLQRLVAAGHLGKKTGRGLQDYPA